MAVLKKPQFYPIIIVKLCEESNFARISTFKVGLKLLLVLVMPNLEHTNMHYKFFEFKVRIKIA